MKDWVKLIICLIIPLLVGAISGMATLDEVNGWYATLHKPSFNPPNNLFGPVWTILYLLMGTALFLVVTSKAVSGKAEAVTIFCVQLALNFSWSFVFFKFHLTGFALLNILLLWVCILLTIMWFGRIRKVAGFLLIPYLLWVTFASVLNASILFLN